MATRPVPLAPIFGNAVSETIRGILGETAGGAFFDVLRSRHSLREEDFFNRLSDLNLIIQRIFTTTSKTIEKAIAKRFYAKLGLRFVEWPNATLLDYVDSVAMNRATKARVTGFESGGMTEVVAFCKEMEPHQHVIAFYETPQQKRELLFPYLNEGMKNGEAAAYVVSEETPDEIREAMKTFGIDVESLERSGALQVIPHTQWYYLDGYFDKVRTSEMWKKMYDDATARGFRGLRVTGEMHCFFDHAQSKELVEYEQALHREVDLPIKVVCAYRTKDMSIELFHDLISAHSSSLFLGPELQLVA